MITVFIWKKRLYRVVEVLIKLATPRGFEPLISTVTGWHVSPLHHGAILVIPCFHSCAAAAGGSSISNRVYQRQYIVSRWLNLRGCG